MSQKDGKLDIDPVDYLDTWKVCKSANIFRICNVIKIDNFSQFQTALRFHYAISANLDILILIFFDSLKTKRRALLLDFCSYQLVPQHLIPQMLNTAILNTTNV